jgi:glycosyltransferase involved in cell wall biosynthesis
MTALLFVILGIHAFVLAVVIYNYFTAPVLGNSATSQSKYTVSVLIPARNEAERIAACLEGFKKQTYQNIEVLVLDDNSTDGTFTVAHSFGQNIPGFKLLQGTTLPAGWLGKNWACSQLASAAKGDILLFVDADVMVRSDAVERMMNDFASRDIDVLSTFPVQIMKTFGENLIVPLQNWLLLSFLPLHLVHASSRPSLSAGIGQFLAFKRDAYFKLGGHESVALKQAEDLEFMRNAKKIGLRTFACLSDRVVFCRMYTSLLTGIQGYSRTFYPGTNTTPAVFLLLLMIAALVFLLPYLLIFIDSRYFIPLSFILFERVLISVMSRQNGLVNLILHPLQMLVLFITGIRSLWQTINRKQVWKGRILGV